MHQTKKTEANGSLHHTAPATSVDYFKACSGKIKRSAKVSPWYNEPWYQTAQILIHGRLVSLPRLISHLETVWIRTNVDTTHALATAKNFCQATSAQRHCPMHRQHKRPPHGSLNHLGPVSCNTETQRQPVPASGFKVIQRSGTADIASPYHSSFAGGWQCWHFSSSVDSQAHFAIGVVDSDTLESQGYKWI
jgi:hypothetical protein